MSPENNTNPEQGNVDETTFLLNRHTLKNKPGAPEAVSEQTGVEFKGITPEGAELVREKVRTDLLETIEKSAPGSVVILGGASDLYRTKSSCRVATEELQRLLAERSNEFLILDETAINNLVQDRSTESTLHALQKVVSENSDKKVIISYPLYLQEITLLQKQAGRMADVKNWKVGDPDNEVSTEIVKEYSKMSSDSEDIGLVLNWVRTNGRLEVNGKVLEGANPTETAQRYTRAFLRLQKVAKQLFPNRPLTIQITGHSWDIDVFIAYVTHHGKIDVEGVKEIAAGDQGKETIIEPFEAPVIKISSQGAILSYRGKEYPVEDVELLEKEVQENPKQNI